MCLVKVCLLFHIFQTRSHSWLLCMQGTTSQSHQTFCRGQLMNSWSSHPTTQMGQEVGATLWTSGNCGEIAQLGLSWRASWGTMATSLVSVARQRDQDQHRKQAVQELTSWEHPQESSKWKSSPLVDELLAYLLCQILARELTCFIRTRMELMPTAVGRRGKGSTQQMMVMRTSMARRKSVVEWFFQNSMPLYATCLNGRATKNLLKSERTRSAGVLLGLFSN